MEQRTVIWKPIEYPGMEYLSLREQDNTIQAQSIVIGVIDQVAFRLDYHLTCDQDYMMRKANLTTAEKQITLISDSRGNWFDRERKPLPDLAGCIDVDISATPFTNTLPIRRIQWQIGQSETLKMVYIRVPELSVQVDEQRYTCLDKASDGARFLYESIDSDFKATITVDSDGLVVNYPGLFERVWSS